LNEGLVFDGLEDD
jgi:RNA dependent RNA polymerase